MDNHYFEQFLNAKFEGVDNRFLNIERELENIQIKLQSMNNINKVDAIAIENLKNRITLISSLVGAGVAALLSGLLSFFFRGSR